MLTPTLPWEEADVGMVGFDTMKSKLSFFCLCWVAPSFGDCWFLVIPARFYLGFELTVPLCVTAELLCGLMATTRDADL